MIKRIRQSTVGMVIIALLGAPCVGGITLTPIGLGAAFMGTGLFLFLDQYRLIFMAVALILLGVTIWELRGATAVPTTLVRVAIVVALLFIAAELIVDPLWARHALVPMS